MSAETADKILEKVTKSMREALDGYGNESEPISEYSGLIKDLLEEFEDHDMQLRYMLEFIPYVGWKWKFCFKDKNRHPKTVETIKGELEDIFSKFFSNPEIDEDDDETLYAKIAQGINSLDLGFSITRTIDQSECSDDDEEEFYTYTVSKASRPKESSTTKKKSRDSDEKTTQRRRKSPTKSSNNARGESTPKRKQPRKEVTSDSKEEENPPTKKHKKLGDI